MIISPEIFVNMQENKTYEQLLKIRDKLIRKIKYFEKHKDDIMDNDILYCSPASEVAYQCNLECLEKLCALINKKYCEQTQSGK